MYLAMGVIGVAISSLSIVLWIHRKRDLDELEQQHTITARELQILLASDKKVPLFDVRQPLDLLAYPEIIPGAKRIPPEEVLDPSLIPKEEEVVVYCTCPGEKTSRKVLHRALAMQFSRIKFLKGGLAAWKANGYPVEPYREVFHLYDPPSAARSG